MNKKPAKKAPRKKRKHVGDRSAATGQFVTPEFAKEHPSETVAVTKEIEPLPQGDEDEEC